MKRRMDKIKEYLKGYINKFKKKPWLAVLVFIFMLFSAVTFEMFNRPWGVVTDLKMRIDDKIPFIPGLIIIYNLFSAYIILAGIILFANDEEKEYKRYVLALFIGQIIAYFVFVFFQTYVTRADVSQMGNSLSEKIVKGVYTLDNCYSGLPSLHVTDMFILIIAVLKSGLKKKLSIPMSILAFVIAISTVLVKQHVFIDIPAGIVNAIVSYAIAIGIISILEKRKVNNVGIGDKTINNN